MIQARRALRRPRRRAEDAMLSSLTVRGWPRRVEPAEPIPHPFLRAFKALQLPAGEPPVLLYSPRLRFGPHESSAKLMVWAGDRVACLDARRGGVVSSTLSLDAAYEVEWGQALLETWLRLVAPGPGGPTVIRVELNTIGRDLYLPLLGAARSRFYAGAHLSIADERAKLNPLMSSDYRFVGFGRQALQPGAELRRYWFQPRMARPLLGMFHQVRVPALLLMVTQAELILVQEQAARGAGRYGAIWSYLPLARIQGVDLAPDTARGVLLMRVRYPDGGEHRCELDPALETGLRAFLRETDPGWAAGPGAG
jgi:hypothetical protein